MKSAPGERFSYSNSGFVLLGLLIEQHTGIPFSDYIEAEVFTRAGMSYSGFFDLDRLPRRTSFNYLTNEDPASPRTNIYTVPIAGQPDGGAFVTASDMASFWSALRNEQLLTSSTTQKLLEPHVSADQDGGQYGYGV